MEVGFQQALDVSLKQSVPDGEQEPTGSVSAVKGGGKDVLTYVIYSKSLRRALLIFLLHLQSPFFDGLPLSNVLRIFGGCRSLSFTLSFCFLPLHLLLKFCLFLLGSSPPFYLTLLLKFALRLSLVLSSN